MDVQVDRTKLGALTRVEFEFLERTLAGLDEPAMTEPDERGWSIVDHLGHIDAWHRRLLRWFAEHRAGTEPVTPEAGYGWDEIDRLNQDDRAARRGRPAALVLAELRESYAACLLLIDSLTEEELTIPNQFTWFQFGPMAKLIAHNTYLHYVGHTAAIRRRLGATDWETTGE